MIRQNGMNTRVDAGKLCASACTYAFTGGVKRTIDPSAVIQFHPVTINSKPKGWTDKHFYSGGQWQGIRTVRNYVGYIGLHNAEAFSEFLQKIYANTWHNQVYTANYGELVKTGFITE